MTVTVTRRVISLTGRGARGATGLTGAIGGNIMAIGLFVALSTISVPGGTTLVQTSGHTNPEKGAAIYVEDMTLDDAAVAAYPHARAKSANGRYFRLSHYQLLGPYHFGCLDSNDGTLRDAGPAMQAMHDYLHAVAVNPSSGGGFYKGTAPINWPQGHFHSSSTTIEPAATIAWLGAGSGLNGPSGGAGTLLTWGANCTGVRLLFPDSVGDTGVLGTIHDGVASFFAKGMCWQSTFDLTAAHEAEFHGFVARAPYFLEDVYIKNFPGAGFMARAGLIQELSTNISGNVSCSRAINVKCEGNRDGFWVSGGDANILQFHGCWAYQNTRYGLRINSGAGSNLITGLHCASNGLLGNVGTYTQCSTAGERYALAEGGNPLNAPSGTTLDTADWIHIEAGGAVANLIPTWAATPGLFRSGGDMVTFGADGSRFLEDYSENGGFNKFASSNTIDGGTIADQYFRGGTRINTSSSYGFRIIQSPNATLTLQHNDTQGGIVVQDGSYVQHSAILFSKTAGNYHFARDVTGNNFYTQPYNGPATLRGAITINGVELPAAHAFFIGGLQVLGARRTGWAADTGTARRAANATYGAGAMLTYSATYVQSEQTAMATRMAAVEAALQNLSQTQKALKDDLTASGVIGA